jgi:hypothetical protein
VLDDATCGRTQDGMMAGDMTRDAAHCGAFEATFGITHRRQHEQQACEGRSQDYWAHFPSFDVWHT